MISALQTWKELEALAQPNETPFSSLFSLLSSPSTSSLIYTGCSYTALIVVTTIHGLTP